MKLVHTMFAAAIGAAMVLSLSACNKSNPGSSAGVPSASQTAPTPATRPMNTQPQAAVPPTAATASTATMPPASAGTQAMAGQSTSTNWFGGPIYNGAPDLAATAALVKAGGGADHFDFAKALNAMLGEKTVNAEVEKLNKQYGKDKVQDFIKGMTFAVNDSLKRAKEDGVTLPPPANLTGKDLAKALVKAGTAPDGTFWAGYMFDHTVSHKVHDQVMADIDAKSGHDADGNTHKILNQAMYDVAQALDMKDVKLASFH